MKWESMQTRWQDARETSEDSKVNQMLQRVKQRDHDLHQSVRRRDFIETAVALMMVPIFGFAAWSALNKGSWLAAIAAVLLVACCLYVPWRLRQARRLQPDPEMSTDIMAYLKAERAATQAQYELLKGILVWYLGPIGVAVILFYFGVRGWSLSSLYYTLFVVGLYFVIYLLNQRVAVRKIAPRLGQIDEQIFELDRGQTP